MRVSASSWYELYDPSECARRVSLIAAGVQGAEPGAYEVVLEELGRRHESAYLATLEPAIRIAPGTDDQRMAATLEAIHSSAQVIYQPYFKTNLTVEGENVALVGNPDFLVLTNAGYVIRDAKLARHVSQDEMPQVYRQLQTYGFLFETLVGQAAGLQVYDGLGTLQDVSYEGADAFRAALAQLVRLRRSPLDFYEPVGWSKCQTCPFKSTCWPEAEARRDVSLVYGVSQEMAKSLHEAGIVTIEDLARADENGMLPLVPYRFGNKVRTIGKAAAALTLSARALVEGREVHIALPVIPPSANFVSFDLEGVPIPAMPEETIYLWGIQVFGVNPGPYQGITSDFEEGGDRRGWQRFLEAMAVIFDAHGDIPLVVYSSYEATHVRLYLNRHGDWNGVGARVLRNLWDMLPAIRNAVALPLYSYSLKQVELYVGFQRTQEEFGGSWSIAQYFRALESQDPATRNTILNEILTYNAEDLQATIRVFEWLRGLQVNP